MATKSIATEYNSRVASNFLDFTHTQKIEFIWERKGESDRAESSLIEVTKLI